MASSHLGCLVHTFRPHVAKAGGNHARFNAGVRLGPAHAFRQAFDIELRIKSAALRMVGGDENLAIDRAIRGDAFEIGLRQQRIVLFRAEQRRRLVISALRNVVKSCQTKFSPSISPSIFDTIFVRLRRDQRRRSGAFDMTMQFGFDDHDGPPVIGAALHRARGNIAIADCFRYGQR